MRSSPSSTAADDAVAAWEQVLRECSAAIDEQRALLLFIEADPLAEHDVAAVAAFVPPAAMPPLPDSLVPMVGTLVDITNGLTELAARLAARSQPRLAARPVRTGQSTMDALL